MGEIIEDLIKKQLIGAAGFANLRKEKGVLAILSFGSVARGNFIEGWSDVDLMIVVREPSLELLREISRYQKEIEEKIKVPVGIDVLPGELLLKAEKDLSLAKLFVPFVKNFYQGSDFWEKGVLYLKNGERLPVFKKEIFKSLDLRYYFFYCFEGVKGVVLKADFWMERKYVLRKLVKNILFFLQTILARETGEVISDYDEIIRRFEERKVYDLFLLKKIYQKRFVWKETNKDDFSEEQVKVLWELLVSLFEREVVGE